jgi:hypothetical protein
MPDNTPNFVVDAVNGPVSSTTTTRTEFITALEQLNYAEGTIRSIDELSGTAGLLSIDGSGNASVRSIVGATGLTVANGDGSANPEISLNEPHTFRQSFNDTSSNTVSDTKLYNIISSASSPFTLPVPASGYITVKNIINATSSFITIQSSSWGPAGLGDVRVSAGETLTIVSDTAGNWYPQHVTEHDVNPFGAIAASSGSATPVNSGDPYAALLVTTATQSNMTEFDMPSNGQLRYTGDIAIDAEIQVSFSGSTNGSNVSVLASLFKHDSDAGTNSQITATEQIHHHPSNGHNKNISLIGHVELDTNDYVYVAVKQSTLTSVAGVNYTPLKFYMSASGHRIITA